MAWNHRRVWVGLMAAGMLAGAWGCQQDNKSGGAPKAAANGVAKEKASNENPSAEGNAKYNEDAAPKQSEKVETLPEPSATPGKTPDETAANSADDIPPPVPAPQPAKPTAAATTVPSSPAAKTAKQPLPPPATIPKVSLGDKLRATCLVNVGDQLPESELTGLDGNKVALKSLYGESLTVVFFWSAGTTPHAQQAISAALGDMQKDVLEPFAAKQLKVVGINVGNPPEEAKKAVDAGGATFPVLLDPQGDYFKTVATEKLPRVYLLDGSGKIRWFDIEYARATLRDLLTAIRAVLEGKK